MSHFQGKNIVITGGSDGIGRALVQQFLGLGAKVATCGRNREKLKALESECASEHLMIFTADVSKKEDCDAFIQAAIQQLGGIDVLINNAGISMRSMFETVDLTVLKQVMDINFWGTVYATHAALPHIKAVKGGIIGISSIAGYRGLPVRTGYSASKFAMNGFLEALRTELLETGVHVLIACPGFTASNIRAASLNSEGRITGETMRDEGKMMSAEEVATRIAAAYEAKKKTLVLTLQGKLTVFLNKWLNGFTDRLVYNTLKKVKDSPLQ